MAEDHAAIDLGVGVEVLIHSLSSASGSRFNGCRGTITQINPDGRRVVKLKDSDSLPVVQPMNLRTLDSSAHSASAPATSGIVAVVGLQSERGRLLNGLLGRLVDKPSSNGRFTVELFATGQRKALKEANFTSVELEEIVHRLQAAFDEGHLYEMSLLMQGLPNPPKSLKTALSSRIADGTHYEILGNSLELVDISGKGKGYCATRNISAGEAMLFEASFCSAREGPREYEGMAEQCKAKASASAEAAEFLANRVMVLAIGNPLAHMLDKSRLISILKNNAFKTIRDPDYCALFAATSRFNHSCCANALADTSKDRVVVRALRDIDAGEEVCISYVPVHQTREERQGHLLGKGFVCKCPRCEQEKGEDPQFAVPCNCAQHNFSAQDNAVQKQPCPNCGAKFSKAEALMHLEKLQQMNDFMRTPVAAAANPLDLIKKLEPLVSCLESDASGSNAPRAHPVSVQLLNNLAGAHYFAATRVPGPHCQASSKAALSYKRKVLMAMASNHGQGTAQRDVNYFMAFHRMLMGEFPTAEERTACEDELAELCMLHFGQVSLPAGITASVCR
eukprot:TRINITY_DN82678_c0_g1_i1.p1 TRINITY_DN82678_c0_g1~~TRINITY_DN82678_c0_g1_i1.p1  ORF type:complete len:564 (+),score=40.91 TRINITY_DN82678_c0_g1_i1:62-1753(+)